MNIRNLTLTILMIGIAFASQATALGLSDKEVAGLKIDVTLTAGTLIIGTSAINMAIFGTVAGGLQGAINGGPVEALTGGSLGCISGGVAGAIIGLALTSALCYKLKGKKEKHKQA